MSEKSSYSISELEELSGVPAHTIRTWERRYGLLKPVRDAGNTRCYGREVVSYLRHLVVLLRQGHRISTLAAKTPEEIRAMLDESALPDADEVTASLCQSLTDFQVGRVESLLHCYIKRDGFDATLEEHVLPFLGQAGFLLLSGTLQEVHIRMFNEVLRQKLYAANDGFSLARDAQTWLLIHGKADSDAIHRDILKYLLQRKGQRVVRLEFESVHADVISTIQPTQCLLVADDETSIRQIPEVIEQLQGNTLIFTPGKTLNFVNNPQIQQIPVIHGLQEAFHIL